MEKLPQRNLLLPNAPITPFSTTKKNKHPFKQLLSSGKIITFINNIFDSLVMLGFWLFVNRKSFVSLFKLSILQNQKNLHGQKESFPIKKRYLLLKFKTYIGIYFNQMIFFSPNSV
jgi:hypothetical protein